MNAVATLWLGVRLAVASTGRSRARVGLAAVGVAFAVALITAGLAIAPAAAARGDRAEARAPMSAKGSAAARDGVLAAEWTDRYLGREIAVFQVADVGRPTAPPPGLRALPRAGEMAASPALARLLASPRHETLRARYRARVTATVERQGLLGPDELVAWVGAGPAAFARDETPVAGFGGSRPDVAETPAEVRVAVPFGVVGLLVPILVLVATATRVGAAERDRRLSALRLLGVTPAQARLVASGEALVASLLGTAGGVLLFAVTRSLSRHVPVRGGVWPADVSPPLTLVLAVVLAIPAIAVVAATVAQRAVIVSPLGTSRRARQASLRAVRLVPLGLGLALLVAAYAQRVALRQGEGGAVLLLVGSAALFLAGLALATPLVAQLAARRTASWARGVPTLLAARRVDADPHSVARLVTGTTLLVFVAGWLLAILPLLAPHGEGTMRQLSREIRDDVLYATLEDPAAVDAVREVPGVVAVAPMYRVDLAVGRDEDVTVTATDCVALGGVLRQPLPACDGNAVHLRPDALDLEPGRFDIVRYVDESGPTTPRRRVGTFVVSERPVRTDRLTRLGALNLGAGLVPLAAVPRAALDTDGSATVLVATDGDPTSVERARTALGAALRRGGSIRTIDDLVADEETAPRRYRRIALAALAVAGAVATASLAVALADGTRSQRRSLAALAACGTPVRVLRRAVLGQTALAVLPSVTLALVTSAASSALYLRLDDDRVLSVPWPELAALAAGCGAVVLIATAVTLPAIRDAAHPRELRVE